MTAHRENSQHGTPHSDESDETAIRLVIEYVKAHARFVLAQSAMEVATINGRNGYLDLYHSARHELGAATTLLYDAARALVNAGERSTNECDRLIEPLD